MSSLDEFYAGGPRTTAEAFPPACLRTHWDPTMVVKHVLPDFYVRGVLDPRPAAKICFEYHHTSAGDAPLPRDAPSTLPPTPYQFVSGMHRPAPAPSSAPVFPPGGAAALNFPYGGYRPNVETDVLRIDEPLTKCAERRYIPAHGIPEPSISGNRVPNAPPVLPPEVLNAAKKAGCREADDLAAWARSDRLFFNPTRYDRTIQVPPGLQQASSRHAVPFPFPAERAVAAAE